ncbi:MAG: hypothetical protein FJ349_01265 [Sphingomonadales bacterium]|nr:hypothetical protein [Sphingomonadales bacterium]
MSWFVGQEVVVLQETGIFKVAVIEHSHLVLEDENGFTYRYHQTQVAARQHIPSEHLPIKDVQTVKKVVLNKDQRPGNLQLPTIDLHAENLNLPIGLGVHDILLAQLSAFKNFCNAQHRSRKTKFLVIHGAGEGRLKQEIRGLVNSRLGIQMHDAQWSNGAVGASQIELVLHQFECF